MYSIAEKANAGQSSIRCPGCSTRIHGLARRYILEDQETGGSYCFHLCISCYMALELEVDVEGIVGRIHAAFKEELGKSGGKAARQ